jgi:hypothetical protein
MNETKPSETSESLALQRLIFFSMLLPNCDGATYFDGSCRIIHIKATLPNGKGWLNEFAAKSHERDTWFDSERLPS